MTIPTSPNRVLLRPPSVLTAGSSKSAPAVPSLNSLEHRSQSPEARMRPLSLQRPSIQGVQGMQAVGAVGMQRRGSLPKPRSNSSLTSSRPAPPSPAPSRPTSQVIESPTASLHSIHALTSPGASASNAFGSSPSGSSVFGTQTRDRSCSSASRRSVKGRPKSLLGLVSTSASQSGCLATAEEEHAEHERVDQPVDTDTKGEKPRNDEKVISLDKDDDRIHGLGLGLLNGPADIDSTAHGGTRHTSDPLSVDVDKAKAKDKEKDKIKDETRPSVSRMSSGSKSGSAPLTPATLSALNALTLDESGAATPRATNPALEAEALVIRRVKVRDYAFHVTDLRFVGLGPHRSRSNWSEGEPEPTVPAVQTSQESWGFSGFGFGASFGPSSASPATEQPSTGLSFGLGSWTKRDDEDVADHSASDYWSEDDELGPDEIYYHGGGDEEPDGLYRTAYPFAPEGINEIAVDVGEFLDVRGRGGGEGWVVGTRLRDGVEGLVPEGYLERCSEEDAEFDEQWEVVRRMRREREQTPDSLSGNSENDEKERW